MVLAYDDEGGIAKMIANKLTRARNGSWVLPFWREMGGPAACRQRPELHGEAGVLLTRDQARSAGSVCSPLPAYAGAVRAGALIRCSSAVSVPAST